MSPAILVVDDEPDILDAVAAVLRFAMPGAHVMTASEGREALALLAGHPVDLVLSDLKMPRMDGIALLSRVRQEFPRCARILMTAYPEAGLEDRAQAAGVGCILHKPYDLDRVVAAVEAELARQVPAGPAAA